VAMNKTKLFDMDKEMEEDDMAMFDDEDLNHGGCVVCMLFGVGCLV